MEDDETRPLRSGKRQGRSRSRAYSYDDNFSPLKEQDRRCHDVAFLLLFLVVMGGVVAISVLAFEEGNAVRILHGTDTFGNLCGFDNRRVDARLPDFSSRPYSFEYQRLQAGGGFVRLCVPACASTTAAASIARPSDIRCMPSVAAPTSQAELEAKVARGECAPGQFRSSSLFYRCYPSDADDQFEVPGTRPPLNATAAPVRDSVFDGLDQTGLGNRVLADLASSWRWLLLCAFLALLLSAGWTVLLQHFAGCVVWTSVLVPPGVCVLATIYLFYKWNRSRRIIHHAATNVSSDSYNAWTLLGMALFMGTFTLLLVVVIFCLRRRIRMAVAVVREASSAVRALPQLIAVPLVEFVVLGGLFAYWAATAVFLGSAGESSFAVRKIYNVTSAVVDYDEHTALRNTQLFLIFAFLWALNLVIAVGQTTVAGAVGMYYWSGGDAAELPARPVSRSLWRVLRFHLGSLALGSLVIALVQFVRLLITQAQRQLKRSDGQCARFLLMCMRCIFACAESFLKLLHRNAYIEIAMYGHSFCESAKVAFQLLSRNAFRLATVDLVGEFLLFLGKVFIAVFAAVISLIILEPGSSASFYSLPVFCVAVMAYVIAAAFMSVYSMAIDTVFLCFCEDVERNDGSPQRPYFMRPSLQQFLDSSQELD